MDNVTSRFMLYHAYFIISYKENLGEYKLVFQGLKILQAQHPGLENWALAHLEQFSTPVSSWQVHMYYDKNFNIKRACCVNVSWANTILPMSIQ